MDSPQRGISLLSDISIFTAFGINGNKVVQICNFAACGILTFVSPILMGVYSLLEMEQKLLQTF